MNTNSGVNTYKRCKSASNFQHLYTNPNKSNKIVVIPTEDSALHNILALFTQKCMKNI